MSLNICQFFADTVPGTSEQDLWTVPADQLHLITDVRLEPDGTGTWCGIYLHKPGRNFVTIAEAQPEGYYVSTYFSDMFVVLNPGDVVSCYVESVDHSIFISGHRYQLP